MGKATADMLCDDSGTMAVEYGILVAFLAAAVIVLVTDVGDGVSSILELIAGYFPSFSG